MIVGIPSKSSHPHETTTLTRLNRNPTLKYLCGGPQESTAVENMAGRYRPRIPDAQACHGRRFAGGARAALTHNAL